MALEINATDEQIKKWLDYLGLLKRWNKVYNLTSVDEPEAMLTTHLLDSLSIAAFVIGKHIADVGSGGGLPGMPLAILFPEKKFTLLDAVAKKARFQRQAITELKLKNVEPTHARVEQFKPDRPFDQIISRAFSSLADFVSLTQPMLAAEGAWLAMKGRIPEQELAALGKKFEYTVHSLTVPGLDAERHLVQITRKP
ncbi:MAG TPA: 16S rRNA (guanine(527)-N(7))-methyltransferase RsmG [Chromatiales bacterium]|nr:16S rRNA (guanine(527)-N(7))-methyltransferase RsmG [Thiotrichales bacterium]HIP66977.1 16S rRNA (guanine(527)-N(7))-methyltransferase RsmG [Chromatiales bacterium]